MPGLHSNPKTATQKRYDQQRLMPKPMADGSFGRDPITGVAITNRQQASSMLDQNSPSGRALSSFLYQGEQGDYQSQVEDMRKKLMSQR
jgi:hypothetical protein